MGFLRDIGTPGLVVLIIGAVLLFGPKRLPELGQAVGKMFSEFKKTVSQLEDDVKKDKDSQDD
ncbi:twin-arginine translocase TatA/TatE family subunit [Streptococcus minor]|uniref:Twin-arginine translocase TatA/TatE family subunit n=1 Tax=Streptococcus minor TaxID=229549 RepID=A0A3P1V6M9_9STRE|nr:twin-arginine translocase TatA/TatE family subunit [Streptococcus minor]RRD29801.1 twin-arginine translocase TatA/TatE family subunit [Streptococcus minor]